MPPTFLFCEAQMKKRYACRIKEQARSTFDADYSEPYVVEAYKPEWAATDAVEQYEEDQSSFPVGSGNETAEVLVWELLPGGNPQDPVPAAMVKTYKVYGFDAFYAPQYLARVV